MLQKTPLNAVHRALGARMVEFGGWDMPVQYRGVIEEHLAVRGAAGLFDVSHMGEIDVRGPGALAYLQELTINDVSRMVDGQVQYNAMCYPHGGTVDDITLYRFSPERYILCVNASNTDKDFAWMEQVLADADFPGLFALCGKAPQVDGTFGVTAAVTEMLMQSHDGFIKLLPALPDEWREGEFKGVCARGAFELDYAWKDKKITRLTILSKAGEVCRLAYKPSMKIMSKGKPVKYTKLPNGAIEFKTQKGISYEVL